MNRPSIQSGFPMDIRDEQILQLLETPALSPPLDPPAQHSEGTHCSTGERDTIQPYQTHTILQSDPKPDSQASSKSNSCISVSDDSNDSIPETCCTSTCEESNCGIIVDAHLALVPALVFQNPTGRASSTIHSLVLLDCDPNDTAADTDTATNTDTDYPSPPAQTHTANEREGFEERTISSEVPSLDEDMSDSWSGTTYVESACELIGVDTPTNAPSQDHHDLETAVLINSKLQILTSMISMYPTSFGDKGESISSSFVAPDHTQLLTTQIGNIQITPPDLPMGERTYPDKHAKGVSRLPRSATTETFMTPPTTHKLISLAPEWSIERQKRLEFDLRGIGAQFLYERQLRRDVTRPILAATSLVDHAQSTHRHDPKTLLKRILLPKDTSDSDVDAESLNDFLNGLDLIAENLLHRFPKDSIARGIRSALASLRQASRRNIKSSTLTVDRPVAATLMGVRTCHDPQHSTTPVPPDSSYGSLGGQNSGGNDARGYCRVDNPQSSITNSTGPSLGVSVKSQRKKLGARLLACPVKKDDEVHGRHPSCRYKGAPNMSSLKTHLTSRNHDAEILFIRLCHECSDYIIDEHEWRNLHITTQCIQQSGIANKQIRGSGIGKQWLRLYDKIFPRSQRLPSPYVNDPTWRPRALSSRNGTTEPAIQNDGPGRTFSEPSTIESMVLEPVISYPDGETAYNNRSTVFEPISTNAQNESLTIDGQLLNTSQSFLDETLAAVSNEHSINHPDDGFPYYFDDMLNEQLAPTVDAFQETDMQSLSQVEDIDRGRTATLLFILEQSNQYAQRDNNGNGVVTTQQIAYANALNREEFEILTSKAKARIDALAEQIRPRPTSDNQEHNSTTVHVSQGANAWEDDHFGQIPWDDSEFLCWESPSPTVQHEIATSS